MVGEEGGEKMEIQITKDAEKMLCEIYAKYLEVYF